MADIRSAAAGQERAQLWSFPIRFQLVDSGPSRLGGKRRFYVKAIPVDESIIGTIINLESHSYCACFINFPPSY